MKLSKVIKELQDIMAGSGDMEVLACRDVTPDNVADKISDERYGALAVNSVVEFPCGEGFVVFDIKPYEEVLDTAENV